jgi:ABC-type multidrug transport system fused ATPase/permease subunit
VTTASRESRLSLLPLFWRVAVQPHQAQAGAIVGLMLMSAMMDALAVGMAVPLLDVLTGAEGAAKPFVAAIEAAWRASSIEPSRGLVILTLLAVAAGVFVLRGALVLWAQYRTVAVAVTLRRATRVALLDRFLWARFDELTARARGTIVADITGPAEALCGGMVDFGRLVLCASTTVVMLGLLLYLSWWATIVVALTVGTVMQTWRWMADRRAAEQGRRLFALREQQTALQVDALDGVKVVKAYGLEARVVQRYDELMARELRPELISMLLRESPALLHEALAAAVVLALGVLMVAVPSLGLRVSVLAGFLIGLRRLAPAISGMAATSATLHRDVRQFELIEHALRSLPQERRGGRPVGTVHEIRLDGVSFAYPARPQQLALNEVSLRLTRGTTTAVVGATGSGKSTLAALLMRLYEPGAGQIIVDGHALSALDLEAWRRRVGYVSQDVFVFHASLRDNVALWDETATDEQVAWAVRTAQLDDVVAALPEGLATVLGDRGVRLSGGQCQRVAIARALLRRPQVLILDEATSALDAVTERAVHEAVRAVQRDTIVLLIAHRLSTVQDADRIVVMEGGRLVEAGTHEELIGRRGRYARLYDEHRTTPTARPEPIGVEVTL